MVKARAIRFEGGDDSAAAAQLQKKPLPPSPGSISQNVIRDDVDDEPLEATLEAISRETQFHRKKLEKRTSSPRLDPALEEIARSVYGPAVRRLGIEYVVMMLRDRMAQGRHRDFAG